MPDADAKLGWETIDLERPLWRRRWVVLFKANDRHATARAWTRAGAQRATQKLILAELDRP